VRGVVERALAEVVVLEHAPHEDERRAAHGQRLDAGHDVRQRAGHGLLVRPGGAQDHRHRAVGAVERRQARGDIGDVVQRQVDSERRPRRGEVLQGLAVGHARSAALGARQDHALTHLRQGQLLAERGRAGGESGHARRHGVVDAERAQAADLFADGAVDGEVPRLQPRHVLTRCIGGAHLLQDGVQRHGLGVDAARVGTDVLEHVRGDQRARVQAHAAGGQPIAAAQREQVRGPRPGADEMDGHGLVSSFESAGAAGLRAAQRVTGRCGVQPV